MISYKGLSERVTYILGGVEDIFATLEDNITVLNIIKSSRYVGPIRVSMYCKLLGGGERERKGEGAGIRGKEVGVPSFFPVLLHVVPLVLLRHTVGVAL